MSKTLRRNLTRSGHNFKSIVLDQRSTLRSVYMPRATTAVVKWRLLVIGGNLICLKCHQSRFSRPTHSMPHAARLDISPWSFMILRTCSGGTFCFPMSTYPPPSSARSASSASESTSVVSQQVPRGVNTSSKDRLGQQVAYQGAEVACLGEARACPAVAKGEKTWRASRPSGSS